MSTFIVPLESSLVRELGMTEVGGGTPGPAPVRNEQGAAFVDLLREMVGEADQSLHQADEMTTSFARGQQHDLHGTMMALNQANIRLQLVNETRNYLLEAYREVMRMTV
jgi:flagellar hook-basal body complex protein FliE